MIDERGQVPAQGSSRAPASLVQGYKFNRQAFILYVLAEAGDGRPDARGAPDGGARAAERLCAGLPGDGAGHPGQARLGARVKTLLSDLHSAAILSATGAHWEEEWVDCWAMNTDTRTTAIVVAALSRLDAGRRPAAQRRALADGRPQGRALGDDARDGLGADRPDRVYGRHRRAGGRLWLPAGAQRRSCCKRAT